MWIFQIRKNKYDHQEESLVSLSWPDICLEPGTTPIQPNGWALAFHPDFIASSNLFNNLSKYSFFSYDLNEALHVSERENTSSSIVSKKIVDELKQNTDAFQQNPNFKLHRIVAQLLYSLLWKGNSSCERANTEISLPSWKPIKWILYFELILRSGMPTVKYYC